MLLTLYFTVVVVLLGLYTHPFFLQTLAEHSSILVFYFARVYCSKKAQNSLNAFRHAPLCSLLSRGVYCELKEQRSLQCSSLLMAHCVNAVPAAFGLSRKSSDCWFLSYLLYRWSGSVVKSCVVNFRYKFHMHITEPVVLTGMSQVFAMTL